LDAKKHWQNIGQLQASMIVAFMDHSAPAASGALELWFVAQLARRTPATAAPEMQKKTPVRMPGFSFLVVRRRTDVTTDHCP
jgi:hypothetical protein